MSHTLFPNITFLLCAIITLSSNGTINSASPAYQTTDIAEKSLDELVLKGTKHILENGTKFTARAGSGQQAYNVSYTLLNPINRLQLLRQPKSIKYFCRELLAYFKGSLKVNDGLAQASSSWKKLADQNGNISSNYGYYVFHEKVPGTNETQYAWVIKILTKNLDSRRAFININQLSHKNDSKDFPCTIGMQFYVDSNQLCCTVSSRSTDIYTGLPYDMGFFAFVLELAYHDLKEQLPCCAANKLKLGHITMKTNFTQIYNKTRPQILSLYEKKSKHTDEYLAQLNFLYSPANDPQGSTRVPNFAAFVAVAPGDSETIVLNSPDTAINNKGQFILKKFLHNIACTKISDCKINTFFSDDTFMPAIESAHATLQDIYQQTAKTPLMQWIYKHAGFPRPQ